MIDRTVSPRCISYYARSVNDRIHIVCAANESYAIGLAVTIRSLLMHLASHQAIQITILDTGIRDNTREKLLASWQYSCAEISFQKTDLASVNHLPLSNGMQSSVYVPLVIADLIDSDRVLYLDADLIIHTDISPLWSTNIGSAPLGAVQDISVSTPYFNSGVMVLNLKEWRRNAITQQSLSYAQRYPEKIQWWDQDVLNAVLQHTWQPLDPRWNVTVESAYLHRWEPKSNAKERTERLVQSAWITHCLGRWKPWIHKSSHPKTSLFFDYLQHTAISCAM